MVVVGGGVGAFVTGTPGADVLVPKRTHEQKILVPTIGLLTGQNDEGAKLIRALKFKVK